MCVKSTFNTGVAMFYRKAQGQYKTEKEMIQPKNEQ